MDLDIFSAHPFQLLPQITSHLLFLSFVICVSMGSGSTCKQIKNAHFLIFIHQYQVLYGCVMGVAKNRWGAMWDKLVKLSSRCKQLLAIGEISEYYNNMVPSASCKFTELLNL